MRPYETNRELIAQARRFLDSANVHRITTWILCYEMSTPGSRRWHRYESLLQDFVQTKTSLSKARQLIERQRVQCAALQVSSVAIKRRIEKLLTSTSD